jgi:two-component system alkaline phosphatase synthesis response regulator PhoP
VSTVLVVDDEANIRELVGVYLIAAGFEVREARDGLEALGFMESEEPDLVVLDLMLPGVDGLEVCRRIREDSRVPIVMLTAKDADMDKVALLEAGADDYVTKPFSPPELVARVRAVLRRTEPQTGAVQDERLVVGGLALDPSTREVTVDDAVVRLTAKEFDLLRAMMLDPGVVFSRTRLLERVWGVAEYVDERGVDVHIRHLRKKLGDDASTPRFIETVRGAGYRVRRAGE